MTFGGCVEVLETASGLLAGLAPDDVRAGCFALGLGFTLLAVTEAGPPLAVVEVFPSPGVHCISCKTVYATVTKHSKNLRTTQLPAASDPIWVEHQTLYNGLCNQDTFTSQRLLAVAPLQSLAHLLLHVELLLGFPEYT